MNLVGKRKGKSVLKVIEREVHGSSGKEPRSAVKANLEEGKNSSKVNSARKVTRKSNGMGEK